MINVINVESFVLELIRWLRVVRSTSKRSRQQEQGHSGAETETGTAQKKTGMRMFPCDTEICVPSAGVDALHELLHDIPTHIRYMYEVRLQVCLG